MIAVLVAQLAGIDSWLAAGRDDLQAEGREARRDAKRRLAVRQVQHEVIVERCAAHLRDSGTAPLPPSPVSAVIAHRHAWTLSKLVEALTHQGVEVVAAVDDGAAAVGVCVAEQPSLLIIGEHLTMQSGVEVARDVCRFAPATAVVGYGDGRALAALQDAGATRLFPGHLPPDAVAQQLTAAPR